MGIDSLTKCTTEYINGSGMSFLMGTMNLTALQNGTPNETFALPSDVDAISEVILQMRFGAGATNVSRTFLLDLVKKVEVRLGNLVVQTIYPGDIYARNLTEFTTAQNVNTYQALGADSRYATGDNIDFSLSIPFTGRGYGGVNKSFLQAGAVTNSLKLKVYYNKLAANITGLVAALPTSLTTGVCVFSHAMTSTEKNFIGKNIINRPVNTSYSVVYPITSVAGTGEQVTIDLSAVTINVSHILITMNNSLFQSSGTPLDNTGNSTGSSWTPIESGVVASTNTGVVGGWLQSAELVLGNDRTGNVPGSCLSTEKIDLFKLSSVSDKNIYIMKLAGHAFSSAGVPFQRLNNKKLVLKYSPGFTLSKFADTGATNTGASNINVTCCGTQVQSTVGGSISFSA